jgi:putative sugar O-methyltransferase
MKLIQRITELLIKSNQVADVQQLASQDLERLESMFTAMDSGDTHAQPSKYWIELNRMNVAQLQQHGYKNFKRTIALNYFTFVRILPWDSQFLFLLRHLSVQVSLGCLRRALSAPKHDYFSAFNWIQSLLYNFLTISSWEYSRKIVSDSGLLALREPSEGNPALITDRTGALISQDLANSIIEVSAMNLSLLRNSVVLELGAGYGRDAYAILATNPGIKYVIVDIPPALWVAEKYLRNQFPDRRIFCFRDFERFADIESEFADCDIAFFLSTQISLLPDEIADLVINVSSLHEMRREQIGFYFLQFDRLLKLNGSFYFKQWKRGVVPFEEVVINQRDYPIPPNWTCEMSREAPIQSKFFEERYKKKSKSTA